MLLPSRTAKCSGVRIEPWLVANRVDESAAWTGGSSTGLLPAWTWLLPPASRYAEVRAGGGLRLVGCTLCVNSI